MASNLFGPPTILQDLESIYNLALAKENLAIALKAKELLGRAVGLFSGKEIQDQNKKISLADLTEKDIECLIEEIKQNLHLTPKEAKRK